MVRHGSILGCTLVLRSSLRLEGGYRQMAVRRPHWNTTGSLVNSCSSSALDQMMSACDSQSVSIAQSLPETAASWLALTVKPQHELASARALHVRDIESYAPVFSERRRWSDRFKVVTVPLFPGYVFARFEQSRRTTALQCHGIRSIVQFGPEPAQIPDSDMESIRLLIASAAYVEPWEGLIPGD